MFQEGRSDQLLYQLLWTGHAEQELRVSFGSSNMEPTGDLDRFPDSVNDSKDA